MNTIFKNVTTESLQSKIIKQVEERGCRSVYMATKGIIDDESEQDIFELMFIHTFLPYWDKPVVDKVKCLLADNYNIR